MVSGRPSAQVDHPSIDILLISLYSEIEYENNGNYAHASPAGGKSEQTSCNGGGKEYAMKRFRLITGLILVIMCMGLLAGCGGKSEPAAQAKVNESEFLLGSWFAKEAYVNGETRDPDAVFGGVFQLYFSKDGKCTMSIDQKRAVVEWTLTDDGVTLTGDDTYPITFPDESRTTMTATIQGVDVLLEKYEG